jgi:DNA-binding MarR family transcriptional regulator
MVKSIDRLINPRPSFHTVSSEEIGDLLMAVWRRWKSSSPVGSGAITQEQYWVLKTLSKRGPMRVKDLASSIGCTPGSASVAVKRLERVGLVSRDRGTDDERVVTVTLTRKGSEKLESWREEQLRSMSSLFEPLSAQEKRWLRGVLEKALAFGGEVPTVRSGQSRRETR